MVIESKGKGNEFKSFTGECEGDKRKGTKPAKNHPWRRSVTPEVAKYASEKSRVVGVANYKVGGGRPQR